LAKQSNHIVDGWFETPFSLKLRGQICVKLHYMLPLHKQNKTSWLPCNSNKLVDFLFCLKNCFS